MSQSNRSNKYESYSRENNTGEKAQNSQENSKPNLNKPLPPTPRIGNVNRGRPRIVGNPSSICSYHGVFEDATLGTSTRLEDPNAKSEVLTTCDVEVRQRQSRPSGRATKAVKTSAHDPGYRNVFWETPESYSQKSRRVSCPPRRRNTSPKFSLPPPPPLRRTGTASESNASERFLPEPNSRKSRHIPSQQTRVPRPPRRRNTRSDSTMPPGLRAGPDRRSSRAPRPQILPPRIHLNHSQTLPLRRRPRFSDLHRMELDDGLDPWPDCQEGCLVCAVKQA